MNNHLLDKLKQLQKERGDINAFASHGEFLSWSDKVFPLLEFDDALQKKFVYWSDHVKTANRMGRNHRDALSESIGVVNQAIVKLELPTESKSTWKNKEISKIEYPEKVTLKWLHQHAHISLWLWFVGALISAFVAGITFSETQLYQLLKLKTSDSVSELQSANSARSRQINGESYTGTEKSNLDHDGNNTKLRDQLEEERTARLRLEEKMAPRRLTPNQKSKLSDSLKAFSGQRVRIISPDNSEAIEYAADYVHVFQLAGWVIIDSSTSIGVSPVRYDVEPKGPQVALSFKEPAAAKVRQAANRLIALLNSEGLSTSNQFAPPVYDEESGLLEFSVGKKLD